MEAEDREVLVKGAEVFGLHFDEEAIMAFDLFLKELMKWNQKINLTAIRTEKEIVTKHFLDSLSVHPFVQKASFLLDIGSGPGFPGIPLKIVDPDLEVTLIDSVRKKVDFERHIIRSLHLRGIEAVHGRVQEKDALEKMGGRFDRVVSRAFSDLSAFLRLGHPFLKKGGVALAMKGNLKEGEMEVLRDGETGYRLQKTVVFDLPFTPLKRTILLFEKQ